jgi:serine/threonine protein kinase/tryptophan 2,3-dioxygenase
MTAERYQKIKEIFHRAADMSLPERRDFVFASCEDDSEMRRELEKMLDFADDAGDTLEKNAFEIMTGARSEGFPETIGGYKILREIGRGGMGVVYEAVRETSDFKQRVALKIIKRGMDTDAVISRFRHEQKILASLEHPFIARFLDGGMTADSLPFYVMEFVEGEAIDDYCAAKNLSLDEKLKLFREVCTALVYAHQNLVVHRDLKPKNILVTAGGTPKLLDFGIGKILAAETEEEIGTATQFGMMTPAYASPEQIRGERIGTASDIYSLGVILYELLTGQKPYKFNSRSQIEIEKAVLKIEPAKPSSVVSGRLRESGAVGKKANDEVGSQNPKSKIQNLKSLKGDLDTIILKSLRKEISERYVSVGQFSEDIRRYLDGVPIHARPHTFSYRAAKFFKRNRVAVVAATLVFLALCGGIMVAVWQAYRAEQQRLLAEKRFAEVRQLANNVVFKYHDAIADLQGSTAVREMLVRDALQYLDALASEAGNDVELKKELALAYHKLGDVQGKAYSANIGDSEGALNSYRKAIGLFEEVVAAAPEDVGAKENLIKAYDSLALLMTRTGSDPREIFQKALLLNEELLKIEPENSARRVQMVELQIRTGDLATGLENNLKEHLKALALAEELVAQDALSPEKMRALVRVSQRIGTDYQRFGDAALRENQAEKAKEFYAQSLSYQRKMYDATQKLYGLEPKNSTNYRYLALAAINLGEALGKTGETAEALQMLGKAQEIIEEIRRLDPKNTETKFDLLIVHESFGTLYRGTREYRKALDQYRKMVDLDDEIYKADPRKIEALRHLQRGYGVLSEISEALGEKLQAEMYRQKSAETNEIYTKKMESSQQK